MTIIGWVVFTALAFFICAFGFALAVDATEKKNSILIAVITIALVVALLLGMLWLFNNTARGQRMLIDQKSNMNGGLERTVNVYTANGDIIASYTGLIDIDTNDGGYVKFDFEGKRYIYYNCFVETIAEIG